MPEIRYIRHFDKDGKELKPIPYEVSDEELADEADRRIIEIAEQKIDTISNLSEAKAFLKVLVRRLINKGFLP